MAVKGLFGGFFYPANSINPNAGHGGAKTFGNPRGIYVGYSVAGFPAQATQPVLSGSINGSNQPVLNWTASTVTGSTIASYEIFRRQVGTPGPFPSLTSVSGAVLTFTDTTADLNAHAYQYYVIAHPTAGLDSIPSNTVTVTKPPPLNITRHVTAQQDFLNIPFIGTWEAAGVGYANGDGFGTLSNDGSVDNSDLNGNYLAAACTVTGGPPAGQGLYIVTQAGPSQDMFESVTIGANTYTSASVTSYDTRADNGTAGATWQVWFWNTPNVDFTDGVTVAVTFNNVQ